MRAAGAPVIELKAGVRLHGIRPELVLAIHVAEGHWAQAGVPTLVVTAGIEGQHTRASAHYRGCAVDLRTNTLPPDTVPNILAALQAALGPDFFVLYENAGTSNAHVHVEFRPQEAY